MTVFNERSFTRPAFAPSHFTWWPGEPLKPDPLTVTIREAAGQDRDAVLHLLHEGGHKASRKTFVTWLTQNSYSIRLVCRNVRHPIAICVTRTTPQGTRVLFLHVSPPYGGKGLERRLLLLAAAELPEQDTVIRVAQSDTVLAESLRSYGWKVTGTDRDNDEYVFTRRLFRTGPDGGEQVAPPSGSDP